MTVARSYPEAEEKPRVSVEEYLELEDLAETKSEYHNGEIVPFWGTTTDESGQIVAMAGASRDHIRITANLGGEIYIALRGSSCRVLGSDLRVRAEACNSYFYPDLTVACGEERYNSDALPALLNPKVVIEILSKSTSARDRGTKLHCYLSMPSLQEYIIVSSHTPRIESYTRLEDGGWFPSIWVGLDATFVSEALGAKVPLRDVYEGTACAEERENPPADPLGEA